MGKGLTGLWQALLQAYSGGGEGNLRERNEHAKPLSLRSEMAPFRIALYGTKVQGVCVEGGGVWNRIHCLMGRTAMSYWKNKKSEQFPQPTKCVYYIPGTLVCTLHS